MFFFCFFLVISVEGVGWSVGRNKDILIKYLASFNVTSIIELKLDSFVVTNSSERYSRRLTGLFYVL